ncbi:translationally-controlled tumor protein homolog [Lingula anatina]|uniref:Translationally-controlled tumor protein homolog n=1 Tax=Lingula anatina TaxID=7574 RepID=A0A1S3HC16_LINAN|nr:translationally-controlled tumor protein homolog [Lingula anatina]|eukprot:XP_013383558.1 translationally-controlled tumor protein homolog [Lingula anatina]
MKLFRDVISGDELLTDALPMKDLGCVYQVEAKLVPEDSSVSDALIGGNKSAEGGAEDLDDSVQWKLNVVSANNLVETGFSKKDYQTHIKTYMKKIEEHLKTTNPDRVAPFKQEASAQVAGFLKRFKDLEFYTGNSMDPDGMVVLKEYIDKDGEEVPVFYFFKDGLSEEKL